MDDLGEMTPFARNAGSRQGACLILPEKLHTRQRVFASTLAARILLHCCWRKDYARTNVKHGIVHIPITSAKQERPMNERARQYQSRQRALGRIEAIDHSTAPEKSSNMRDAKKRLGGLW